MTDFYDINTRNRRMGRFWECYVGGTNGGKHFKHTSLRSATWEAERLARITGKTVYLFECLGKCKTGIEWEVPR